MYASFSLLSPPLSTSVFRQPLAAGKSDRGEGGGGDTTTTTSVMNDTDQCICNDENAKTLVLGVPLVFIENQKKKKIPNDENLEEHDHDHDHDYQDQEDGRTQTPAEIKLKIKKSLLEFRCKVEDAILGNYLLGGPDVNLTKGEFAAAKANLREITLWGVPLLPSKAHEGTDIVLRKFLKAKDCKVNEAFEMLQKTLIWRLRNNVDGILDEDFDPEVENVGFLDGRDREGRPVSFMVCGVLRDKNLYKKVFGTHQKCDRFFRWRIQLMERAVKKLEFREGGVDSIIQIYDLKNTPSKGMKELHALNERALMLFQNYYPELTHKNVVIYAPFWFYTSQVLFSRIMNQRNKKKFILARSQKTTKTLLNFVTPELLPAEYGGLKRDSDKDFSPADKVLELKIKPSSVSAVEFPINEPGVTVIWDVTVVGWDVSYKEEFIPDDECSYNILLQNQSIVGDSTRNSFYISEPGKIVITVENATFKKKKMYYRSKTRTTVPMFILLS
ncbi:patellin-4-like [Lotus japonicus]|uniref:patellin-4-like n=1 Tax=Lotus japonicus TaxID=34305 RepID=UPI00258CA912|nr:patellin-4-like [Lotus japonicus]